MNKKKKVQSCVTIAPPVDVRSVCVREGIESSLSKEKDQKNK